MKKLTYEIKEKELVEMILNNLGEDIKDYEYKLLVQGKNLANQIVRFVAPKKKFIFKFKRKKFA